MEFVERSAEYRKMGAEMIRKRPELYHIREAAIKIGYCVSDKIKRKGDREVLGECILVRPVFKAFIPYDFIICIYENATIQLSDNQRKLLLFHELLHVGIRDTDGEPEYRVNPHDVEDFRAILDKYGLDWAEEGADIPDITKES